MRFNKSVKSACNSPYRYGSLRPVHYLRNDSQFSIRIFHHVAEDWSKTMLLLYNKMFIFVFDRIFG